MKQPPWGLKRGTQERPIKDAAYLKQKEGKTASYFNLQLESKCNVLHLTLSDIKLFLTIILSVFPKR